jgi:hypothetical protein
MDEIFGNSNRKPVERTVVMLVRFEVFTVVTIEKAVFWDVAPCRYCVNRRYGGTYRLHLQGRRQEGIRERTSVSRCNISVCCTCSCWFARGFLLVFYPEYGGDTLLLNVG